MVTSTGNNQDLVIWVTKRNTFTYSPTLRAKGSKVGGFALCKEGTGRGCKVWFLRSDMSLTI